MKLFTYWRSSSSWRVRIALEYKGLDYEYIPVHLVNAGGEQHQIEHLAKNAMAQIPVLEVGDVYISQSMAIFEYLEEMFPEPSLLPEDPVMRAYTRQLAEIVNSGIQPLQNLSVIQRLKSMDIDPKPWCQHFIRMGLLAYQDLSKACGGQFSCGDAVTWADACLIPQLYNARRFELDFSEFEYLSAIEEKLSALEPFINAHASRQPDAVQ